MVVGGFAATTYGVLACHRRDVVMDMIWSKCDLWWLRFPSPTTISAGQRSRFSGAPLSLQCHRSRTAAKVDIVPMPVTRLPSLLLVAASGSHTTRRDIQQCLLRPRILSCQIAGPSCDRIREASTRCPRVIMMRWDSLDMESIRGPAKKPASPICSLMFWRPFGVTWKVAVTNDQGHANGGQRDSSVVSCSI